MRTLVIGDVHGCYDELQELLDKAALSSDDHIIAIGDLVNKGPQSGWVVDFFRSTPGLRSLMGNHEHKHIRAHKGDLVPSLDMLLTRWQLDDTYHDAIAYMQRLPLYLDLPDALLVHGYFEPGVALEEQEERILVGTMGATDYLLETYEHPWYEYYDGDKPLVVGHKDMSGAQNPFVYRERVYGLDTGCVYGGQLTGLLLPDFEFVTVPAHDDHWARTQRIYGPGE